MVTSMHFLMLNVTGSPLLAAGCTSTRFSVLITHPMTCAANKTLSMSAHIQEEEDKIHPYWYAKVLGIFHVNVRISESDDFEVLRMDFLWVHWFGRDPGHPGGFKKRRLHRIGLLDPTDPESFRFINPSDILRGVHLIPAFSIGKTPAMPENLDADDNDTDWDCFYFSMLVILFLNSHILTKI